MLSERVTERTLIMTGLGTVQAYIYIYLKNTGRAESVPPFF